MNNNRPVNLDLSTLRFPVMAIASILHRIAGIVIFLLLPFMLYYLDYSLRGATFFQAIEVFFDKPLIKFVLWVFSSALTYHIIAGVRHIIMDLGFGEGLENARLGAILVITLATLSVVGLGVWIW